jgi:hypothetical protein
VTKGTIRGSFDEIDQMDPALEDRVARKLIDSPAVHDAAHDLFSSVVSGGLDGMTEEVRAGKVDALVTATIEAMSRALDPSIHPEVTAMRRELATALRSIVYELTQAASAALRDSMARDLPSILSTVIDSSLRAFAAAATRATEDMRAQAREFAAGELAPMIGIVSQEAARQAIVGVREGLHTELDLKSPEVRDGMREIGIGLAQGIAQGTPTSPFTTTFAIASFVLGALLLAALAGVVSLYSRARTSAQIIERLVQRLDVREESGRSPRSDDARPSAGRVSLSARRSNGDRTHV